MKARTSHLMGITRRKKKDKLDSYKDDVKLAIQIELSVVEKMLQSYKKTKYDICLPKGLTRRN